MRPKCNTNQLQRVSDCVAYYLFWLHALICNQIPHNKIRISKELIALLTQRANNTVEDVRQIGLEPNNIIKACILIQHLRS